MKTPYAVLLVRPTDDDLTIRTRFHALSRTEHPDRNGADGVPGPGWYDLTAAYGAVKTVILRNTWATAQSRLSGLCPTCHGFGVTGSRVGGAKIKVCLECNGEGRLMSKPKVKTFKRR